MIKLCVSYSYGVVDDESNKNTLIRLAVELNLLTDGKTALDQMSSEMAEKFSLSSLISALTAHLDKQNIKLSEDLLKARVMAMMVLLAKRTAEFDPRKLKISEPVKSTISVTVVPGLKIFVSVMEEIKPDLDVDFTIEQTVGGVTTKETGHTLH